jgi:hypothetical protein
MWHKTASAKRSEVAPLFPKAGTKWRPMHRKPHQNNQTISIRRFISLAKEKL